MKGNNMSENNRKDFEAEEDIYKDAPGLDPDLEWKEGPIDEAPAEEVPAERIGDFIVRGGDEVVKYVGTDMVVVIPEGITKIDSFFLEGKHQYRIVCFSFHTMNRGTHNRGGVF